MNKQYPSKLRFNFGFFLEAPLGTSRTYELAYPKVHVEELTLTPLNGTFTAVRTSEGVYLSGTLNTDLEITCMRCLTEATINLELPIDELFYYPPDAAPEGEFFINEDGFANLDPLVRELVVVETPLHPICKETCKGLCAQCGQNLNEAICGCKTDNIDPRLAILKNLLN
jgi:uncharacterized protein